MYLVRHDAQAGTRWYPGGNCRLDNLQEKRWSHGWVPHLTLRQGLLPVRQLAMCLFASHFCRSSDLKCRVVPIHPTPQRFLGTVLLVSAPDHQVAGNEPHCQLWERNPTTVESEEQALPQAGQGYFLFCWWSISVAWLCKILLGPNLLIKCHRQGRNTFLSEQSRKWASFWKALKIRTLKTFEENLKICTYHDFPYFWRRAFFMGRAILMILNYDRFSSPLRCVFADEAFQLNVVQNLTRTKLT